MTIYLMLNNILVVIKIFKNEYNVQILDLPVKNTNN